MANNEHLYHEHKAIQDPCDFIYLHGAHKTTYVFVWALAERGGGAAIFDKCFLLLSASMTYLTLKPLGIKGLK